MVMSIEDVWEWRLEYLRKHVLSLIILVLGTFFFLFGLVVYDDFPISGDLNLWEYQLPYSNQYYSFRNGFSTALAVAFVWTVLIRLISFLMIIFFIIMVVVRIWDSQIHVFIGVELFKFIIRCYILTCVVAIMFYFYRIG